MVWQHFCATVVLLKAVAEQLHLDRSVLHLDQKKTPAAAESSDDRWSQLLKLIKIQWMLAQYRMSAS